MRCPNPATEQYVFAGRDGLNHISVPLCEDHYGEEQPAETFDVLEVFEDHPCEGVDDPPFWRCMCHPEEASSRRWTMPEPVHFLVRAQQLGGHVHVHVWAGTEQQADQASRPKVGTLVMDSHQWDAFQRVLSDGDWAQRNSDHHQVTIEEVDR